MVLAIVFLLFWPLKNVYDDDDENGDRIVTVKRKDDDDWVKKCMEYEVEGPRPRGRPKRTWREVVREDCQARKMNKEDAVDRCKWRNMLKDVR